MTQFIPWWVFAWDEISRGSLPLWNDMLGMGAPLIANYQSALFYPVTWLYYILYSIGGIGALAWFQSLVVVFHLAWASLGMALLIRKFNLSLLAQLIAGLAFGMSGYLISRAGFLSINATVSWLPWIVLAVTHLIEVFVQPEEGNDNLRSSQQRKKIFAFISLVLVFALQLLSGHAQSTWYTLIFTIAWTIFFIVFSYQRRKQRNFLSLDELAPDSPLEKNETSSKTTDNRENPRQGYLELIAFMTIASAFVFAVGIAAIQLLPTGEYLLQSQRSAAVDYEFAMSYSFWPWRFLSFISPDLFGNPVTGDYWGYANYWEDAVYIGLIPFILAISAIFVRKDNSTAQTSFRRRLIWFLLIVILMTFTIALGQNTPIFPWLYQNIPTFSMFQAPTRISILAVFSLAILAALGAETWRRPEGRRLYWLRLGVMAAGAITIGAGIAYFLSQSISMDIRPSFIRGAALLGFWGVGFGFLALKAPRKNRTGIDRKDWGWWQWAVIIWVGLDLVVAGWGLNPSVDIDVYQESSLPQDLVPRMLDGGRIYLPKEDEEFLKFEQFLRFDTFKPFDNGGGWENLRAALLPNVAILDSIPSANNFDPLLPRRYVEWMNRLNIREPAGNAQILNLMNVTVVETVDSTKPNGVRFEQREALPRFRWASCAVAVEGADSTLDKVFDSGINFENEVIIEVEKLSEELPCGAQAPADINVISLEPARKILEVNNTQPGYLVIADVWYPGWSAIVDGQVTPILHANYLFQAVKLTSGDHEIIISYRPKSFQAGSMVSAASIVGLIILALIGFQVKRSATKELS